MPTASPRRVRSSPSARRRSSRRPAAPKPPAAPVDAFAEHFAHADDVARQLLRDGGLHPEAADGWPFADAVDGLARDVADDVADYRGAEEAMNAARQLPLQGTIDAAFRAYLTEQWTYETTRVKAAYLLGLAVGRRLAPGVPL